MKTKELKTGPSFPQEAKSNFITIVLYALAIASALGFNELVSMIFRKYTNTSNEIFYKALYVAAMLFATLLVAYFTSSAVNL